MVNHDRFGLFRSTANEDGDIIHPEWLTIRNVHLDVSSMSASLASSILCSHCTIITRKSQIIHYCVYPISTVKIESIESSIMFALWWCHVITTNIIT